MDDDVYGRTETVGNRSDERAIDSQRMFMHWVIHEASVNLTDGAFTILC